MRLTTVLLVSAIAAVSPSLVAADDIPKVSRYFSGSTSGRTFTGTEFVLAWKFAPYDGREVKAWIGGDSTDPPAYVIEELRLSLGGVEVPIPESAYFDIFDPPVYSTGPYILEDSRFVYLVIHASDGAGAAKVRLKFRGGNYVGREVETH